MDRKKIFTGLTVIIIGVWFYFALSTFQTEEHTFLKKLIIKEGTIRTEEEVAEALANNMGFDLEGAYKSGYTSSDVIEYLIQEPHTLSVTYHEGRFYQGRRTVPYIIPLAVCILFVLTGMLILLFALKSRKSD